MKVKSKYPSNPQTLAYTMEKSALHDKFFKALVREFKFNKIDADIIAVLHILPDSIAFTKALSKIANINLIIPKPKSINLDALNQLDTYPIIRLKRKNISRILKYIGVKNSVFLDIGGYFANIVPEIQNKIDKKFKGVVEDTENGLQKYEAHGINFPFLSVARSPLKENEDCMVGQAIVHSAETILRQHSILINGLNVGVIGFGKVGRSVAHNLKLKNGQVSVCDLDHIRLTHAQSSGFNISKKSQILSESNILCLATGNMSLSQDYYHKLKTGAWVFTVTSSDDEMDKTWLEQNYHRQKISPFCTKYYKGKHYFYLLNEGNAINFVHGTTVGDFILLVHAEILVATYMLLTDNTNSSQHALDHKTRLKICKIWLSHFGLDH